MVLCLSSTTLFPVLLLLACFDSVRGWGPDGHSLVAGIAQSLLTNETSTFVRNHLAPTVNGNMSQVASWADSILYPDTDPDYLNWQWSKTLHYVDTKDWTCAYDRPTDCDWSGGQRCVDGAVQNYTKRLADSQLDPTQRQEALQFLIHFIGDAHQPLHAGFAGDLGGNTIHGHFIDKKSTLHALWDTGLIEYKINNNFTRQPQLYLNYLIKQMNTRYAQNISDWTQCPSSDESRYLACSTSWIQEDAKLNCEVVYLDENGEKITPTTGFNLGEKYYNTRIGTVEQRLIQGGVRLAAVLNKIVQSIDKKKKKSDGACSGTMLLMMVLVIQSTLILILLMYSLLRRKTKIVIQLPVTGEKKEHVAYI